jgi:hypothetical protein
MARRAVNKSKDVIKIFPLFLWRLCSLCKEEFRREYGWAHNKHEVYLCLNCAKTAEHAQISFDKLLYEQSKKRPLPKGTIW